MPAPSSSEGLAAVENSPAPQAVFVSLAEVVLPSPVASIHTQREVGKLPELACTLAAVGIKVLLRRMRMYKCWRGRCLVDIEANLKISIVDVAKVFEPVEDIRQYLPFEVMSDQRRSMRFLCPPV